LHKYNFNILFLNVSKHFLYFSRPAGKKFQQQLDQVAVSACCTNQIIFFKLKIAHVTRLVINEMIICLFTKEQGPEECDATMLN